MRNPSLSQAVTRPEAVAPNPRPRRFQRISQSASPVVGLLAVLTAAAVLFVEASAPAGTFAVFGAGTNNGSSFAAVAVYSPASLSSVAAVDTSVTVTFPAAQPNNNGNGNGYAISGMNVQPPTPAPNCATQTYGAATFRGAAALANPSVTYTDLLSGLAAGPVQNYAGSYSCYQIMTGYSSAAPAAWTQVPGITGAGTQGWYSVQNPRTGSTRIGFFADSVKDPGDGFIVNQAISSVAVPGAGAAHTIVNGDTFTFTFSAPTNQPTYAGPICISTTGPKMWLADWNGGCTTAELGRLTGGTIVSGGGAAHAFTVTWAWTSSSVLRATVTSVNGQADRISGAWAFTSAGPADDMPISTGQTFVVHYNQPTNQPALPAADGVCLSKKGVTNFTSTIYLAASGKCKGSTVDDIGFLVGGTTLGGFGNNDQLTATYTWTDPQTLRITITNLNGSSDDLGGTWTFEPSITGPGTIVKTADATVTVCAPPTTGQLATQACWPTNS